MTTDPITQTIKDVEHRPVLRKVVFGVALFCLASCLLGFFFLVTRLIVPSGFF
ncbi:hypothetical protein [Thalassospira australica]|uniref:hypothetical protein n=1 Tax=Thalassospira australica TaxID=1528106 RepID=UPI000A837193|nr:hypothetical protein [Thalassospira australica]